MNIMINKELAKRLREIEKTLLTCCPQAPIGRYNRAEWREWQEINFAYICVKQAREAMQGKLPHDTK